ncbi:MAG: TonB-dependent receptor [Candidatus Azobacteroides sp.]|nr:TonB-dependent receptor [Candidatus Azobacteroides sp.]
MFFVFPGKSGITFFILPVFLFITSFAFAQERKDSIRKNVLDEVVVTARSYKEVIPAQQLSGEKLEALSSFSVADAIRYFSGVQIKDYGGIGGLKTVDIRSMGTNHLGVFYDGIEIGNAQNGTVDLGRFSLDFIEEISLYNGQKSEIFQSAKDFGSAGTVYLRTRRPKFAGNKKTNFVSYFRTGSFDLVNPSVLWEQKINKNISSNLNAEYVYSSGKYKYRHTRYNSDGSIANDTTAIRENGDIHSLRLEGGFNGYLEQGSWNIKGYFYNSEKGLPGAIVGNVWYNPQRQWDRNAFVQGNFQKQLFKNYDFLVNAKYSNDWMRYFNLDTIAWDDAGCRADKTLWVDNRFSQQEFYISTSNKYSILPAWDMNLSVDYIWNTLDANLEDFVYPTRNTLLAVLATAFEWRQLKGQASFSGTFIFDNVKKQDAYQPDDKQEFTPAVFLSYKPLKRQNLNFRAFYKRIFRMPTFNDLYYTHIGNINLRPEFTTQYNLGFQYDKQLKKGIINYLNFRADAYYNEVIDKIVATPKGGSGGGSLYRWEMMNLGYVEIRGIDVSAQIAWNFPADIQINTSLNYTFQKAQDFTDKNSKWYGGQINYIPWHSGSAIAYAQWRTWDLNYSFIYVGERYHNPANTRENYSPPWYTHDMTLGKTFKFKKSPFGEDPGRLKISAEINNMLNQVYEVITCYPMPGRNYKLILKMEI